MGFFEIGSLKLLAQLAPNIYPPDLCLLSSLDYRSEPPAPNSHFLFKITDNGRGGGGVNSVYLIYFKNFCKCHSVPPPSTTIKN
jgi:hypothetical protein